MSRRLRHEVRFDNERPRLVRVTFYRGRQSVDYLVRRWVWRRAGRLVLLALRRRAAAELDAMLRPHRRAQ